MVIRTKILHALGVTLCVAVTAAFSADWPWYHGPDRTNKSAETGLLKAWPEGGPKLLWTASGLGQGYSGASVSKGVVYSAGTKDKINYVYAFDGATGKLLWQAQAGKAVWEGKSAFARGFEGSRATPTVDAGAGLVYYLSDMGFLIALDAKTGKEKWSLDVRGKYEGHIARYAYSESPLIDGNKLYVAAYGKTVGVLCLDKVTGKVIWEGERLPGGPGDAGDTYAGYASFMLVNDSGFRQLIAYTADYLYGMNAENGKLLWSVPFTNSRRDNCTDILYHDGHVFASSGYGRGSILVKLSKGKDGKVNAETVYDIKLMDNHHGGVILHNGHIYGSGHESKGWFCLDFKTGKQIWNNPQGKGSLTYADGMLYLYDENGKMSLVKAQSDKFTEVSSFEVPAGGKGTQYWAHPVVSNGVLYLRHVDKLYAYDIKAK